MNFDKKISGLRKQNKMSQEEFAELFGVTRQTISSWENKKSYPDVETLIKISDKFAISLDTLLKEDKELVKNWNNKITLYKRLIVMLCLLIIIWISLVCFWLFIKGLIILMMAIFGNIIFYAQKMIWKWNLILILIVMKKTLYLWVGVVIMLFWGLWKILILE